MQASLLHASDAKTLNTAVVMGAMHQCTVLHFCRVLRQWHILVVRALLQKCVGVAWGHLRTAVRSNTIQGVMVSKYKLEQSINKVLERFE